MPDRRSRSELPPSLAEAPVDQEVRVERILIGLVRSRCTDLGLSEGSQLCVEDRSDAEVIVRQENGETACLPSHYAHFVRVGAVQG